MNINKNIVAYMAKHQVSQNDLAQKLGYTQANLSRILKADDIKISQLTKICEALNVPPYTFFDNVPNVSNEDIEGYKERIIIYENIMIDTAKDFKKLLEKDEYTTEQIREAIKGLMQVSSLFALAPVLRAFNAPKATPQTNNKKKSNSKK